MASAKRTMDHEEIRRWVEQRGGRLVHVRRTAERDDPGVLPIDYPGCRRGEPSGESSGASSGVPPGAAAPGAEAAVERGAARGAERAAEAAVERGAARGSRSRRWQSKTERVTINDASREELEALWGVGPAIAQRIVRARRRTPIEGRDDLMRIDGIDGATADMIAREAEFR